MVNVVYWLPNGGLITQDDWLGPKVGATGVVFAFIA